MAKTSRWMTWVLDESTKTDTDMPWTRNAGKNPATEYIAPKTMTLGCADRQSA
ncbi:MAG: hypothetical protein AAGA08_06695 [Pseudomonadota bacterium]